MRRRSFVLLSLLGLSSFVLLANEARRGEKLFEDKKFKESREAFLNAEIDEPSQLQHAYNRGLSELKLGDFEKAAEAFQKSSQSDEDSLKKDSLYNLGHALYGKGDLEGSLKAFDNYLKLDPESKEAKENKEWVEKKIEEQKQQQNKDDKKDSDKNENKDKDKEQNKKENSEQNQDKSEQDKNENSEQNQDNKKEQNKKENSEQNQEEENKNESPEENDKKDEQDKNGKDKNSEDQQEEQKSSSREDQKKEEEQKGSSAGEETKKDLATKEEIERLLRAIDNMQQVYGVPPKTPQKKKKIRKDW